MATLDLQIKSRATLRKSYYFNTIFPLILGSLIYIVFRPEPKIDKVVALIPFLPKFRQWAYIDFWPTSLLGIFFKYHFTDFLWAYSLGWATFYEGSRLLPRFIFCAAFCTFMEAIQLSSIMQATFDWWDVLVQLLGVTCAAILYSVQSKGHF